MSELATHRSTSFSNPPPTLRFLARFTSSGSHAWASPTNNTTEIAMHRCPAASKVIHERIYTHINLVNLPPKAAPTIELRAWFLLAVHEYKWSAFAMRHTAPTVWHEYSMVLGTHV